MRKLKSFLLLSLALIILPTFPILLIAPTKASAATNPVPWAIKTIAGGPGSGQATSVAQKPVNVIASGSNLIVGDVRVSVIREINPNGYESVIAGNGIGGYYGIGGAAVNAEISGGGSVTKDSNNGNFVFSGDACILTLVAGNTGNIISARDSNKKDFSLRIAIFVDLIELFLIVCSLIAIYPRLNFVH